MFNLFKREAKPSYNVYLHVRNKERAGVAPPPTAMKTSTPEWWKSCDWSIDEKKFTHRFGNVYDPQFWAGFTAKDKHEVNFPTAKGCPALADYMSTGYVFKLWSDLFVYAKDGKVSSSFADNYYNSASANGSFEAHGMFPTIPEAFNYESILKLDSDWSITGDPGVSVWFEGIPLEGLTEQKYYTFQGIVPVDQYPLDIKWIFNWTGGDGNFVIPCGTPIIRIVPFVRTEFTLKPGGDLGSDAGGGRQKCPYFSIRKALNKNWSYTRDGQHLQSDQVQE